MYTRIAGPSVSYHSHALPPDAIASKRPLHAAKGTQRAEGGPKRSRARPREETPCRETRASPPSDAP